MIDFVKDKWSHLTLDEKRWVSIGAGLVFCFLLYIFLWTKFTHHLKEMEEDIIASQDLLQWMQQNAPQLQRLRRLQSHKTTVDPNSFYTIVQQSLKENALITLVTGFIKITDDKIQIDFDTVSFDNLINWLNNLWEKDSIKVDQLVVKKTNNHGDVQVSLVIGIDK